MEFITYLQSHELYFLVYAFFCLGMLAEGLFFALTVMFLVYTGIVEPLPAFLSVLLGIFLEQSIFFHLGRRLNRFPRVKLWADRVASKFDCHISEKTVHTILISKFIYGLHRAILVRAGMLNISSKKFLQASVISAIFWMSVIGLFSYFFNASLSRFVDDYSIGFVSLLPFILIFAFLLLEKFLSKYLTRKL